MNASDTTTTTKTLLHVCCAPCSVACIAALRDEGITPYGYFYNPNIHPIKEFRARKTAFMEYAKSIDMRFHVEHSYGLREFIKGVYPDFSPANRCEYCYRVRLSAAAEFAHEHGFSSYTTTLLISPYQNHELIARLGREIGEKNGVEFLYRDFRPCFAEGQSQARELGLYMQKYCGCVFSEEERYAKRRAEQSEI